MIIVNKLQKMLCLLLSLLLLLAQVPMTALAEDAEEVEFPEELIVGHPTVTKGDFFTELFGNDTADIDVRALIHGYNLVNWDQNQGIYVMDPSVAPIFFPGESHGQRSLAGYRPWDCKIELSDYTTTTITCHIYTYNPSRINFCLLYKEGSHFFF